MTDSHSRQKYANSFIIPVLQMKPLRHREINAGASSHRYKVDLGFNSRDTLSLCIQCPETGTISVTATVRLRMPVRAQDIRPNQGTASLAGRESRVCKSGRVLSPYTVVPQAGVSAEPTACVCERAFLWSPASVISASPRT